MSLVNTFDVDLGLGRVVEDTADLTSELDHRMVDFLHTFSEQETLDLSLGLLRRVRSDIKLIESSGWDFFSVEEAPDLFMDLVSDGVLDLLKNEVTEFAVLGLQHTDVVWSVDEAVPSHFMSKLIRHVSLKTVIEVSDNFFRFAFHLHVVDLSDEDGVVEAIL